MRLGILCLALSLGMMSCASTYRADELIRHCKFADDVLEAVKENDLLIAESFPAAKPADKMIYERYLEVNLRIKQEIRKWKKEHCKNA